MREQEASPVDKEITLPLAQYTVEFVTGDRRHAGTSANVFFTLYGKNGDTSDLRVERRGGFDRASTVKLDVEAVWLGDLTKLRVGHDNSGGRRALESFDTFAARIRLGLVFGQGQSVRPQSQQALLFPVRSLVG